MEIVLVLGMGYNIYQCYGSNDTGLFLQQKKKISVISLLSKDFDNLFNWMQYLMISFISF